MSLIKLINNLSSTEKTDLLLTETTRILRYTFTDAEYDVLPNNIINEAVASKDGINLVYKKRLRNQLIESIPTEQINNRGFSTHQDAADYYNNNIEGFFQDFDIEPRYRLQQIIDERKNFEYSVPVHNELTKISAFPHHYQLRLKDKALNFIKYSQNKYLLITMPTGAGKTVLAMEILIDLFRAHRVAGKTKLKVGWIVDSNELAEQSFKTFQKIWKQKGDRKVMAQRYFDKFNKLELRNENIITFGSFTLLSERIDHPEVIETFRSIDLIIVDEAHGANALTYENVLGVYKTQNQLGKILGLTATPMRSDDTDYSNLKGMFNEYYEITNENDKNLQSPIQYLIQTGYLSNLRFQVLNTQSRNNTSNYFNELHESIINECRNLINNKENTIIFAKSKAHAIALNLILTHHNIENELIIGDTPNAKRKEFLERFGDKDESLSVIVNHQILSTGIDVPGMNSIMILGDINSPSLALQILGRAMRGEKNGGNPSNMVYLTRDNYNKLSDYQILENIVLN